MNTPITDCKHPNITVWMFEDGEQSGMHSCSECGVKFVPITKELALERMCEELNNILYEARDDVNEAVNDHLNRYGTNYPSKNAQLEAKRADVAAVDAALAKWQAMKQDAAK